MANISQSLQSVLNKLSTSFPDGVNDPVYQNILKALNDSPSLLSQMNAAASGSTPLLTEIDYGNGKGGDMNGTKMELNGDLFKADPGTTALDFEYIDVMAHEVGHAENAANVASAEESIDNNTSLPLNASLDQTVQWLAQFAGYGLQDEGRENIQGWNDVVNANALLTKPLGLQELIKNDPYAYELFNEQSEETYVPKSGISLNADGTITYDDGSALSASNISAAGAGISLVSPSTGSSIADYADFYYGEAINEASQLLGGEVTVSYAELGLNIPSVDAGMNGVQTQTDLFSSEQIGRNLASSGSFTVPVVVNDVDDNSTSTFVPVSANGGTTLYMYQPALAADGSSSSTELDIGSNGETYYTENDKADANGNKTIDVSGAGDVVGVAGAAITLESNTQATVNGDDNTITMVANSSSILNVSGDGDVITSSKNTINLLNDNTSVQLTGSGNQVSIAGNNQTLGVSDDVDITINSDETGIVINGTDSSYSAVTAGDNDSVSINNTDFLFTGGANTTLNVTGSDFSDINVGNRSTVTITGKASDSYFSVEMSNGMLSLLNDAPFYLAGSGNTITSSGSTGSSSIQGDNNTFNGAADNLAIMGANNTITLADGAQVEVGDQSSGNTVNLSGGTINFLSSSASATATVNGSDNGTIYVADGIYAINGDRNIISIISDQADSVVNVAGSNNTLSGVGDTINFLSGDGNIIDTEESTIHAAAGTYTLTGDTNTFTGTAGSIITLVQSQSEGNAVSEDDIVIDQSTIVLNTTADSFSEFIDVAVTGMGNSIQGTETVADLALSGDNNTVSLSKSTINFSGGTMLTVTGAGDTVHASNATVTFAASQAGGTLTLNGNGNTVQATDQTFTLANASAATVNGAGNTITSTAATLTLTGVSMSDATTLDGNGSTTTGGVGSYVINGDSTLNAGAGSTIQVNGGGTTLTVNNAQITLADNLSGVTITGSNNRIIGGDGDSISITGTNDTVTASNSSIVFGSNNSGDTVTGPGDTGSNWFAPDPDLPSGDNGGYIPPQQANSDVAISPASVSRLSSDSVSMLSIRTHRAMPDLHSLIHAMATFGADGPGASLDLAHTTPASLEHLHLAVAA